MALGLASPALAKPPKPAPSQEKEPAPAKMIDVRIAEGGQLSEIHVEGSRMTVRSTAGGTVSTRELTAAERAKLLKAARAALVSDDTRRGCGTAEEIYVSVTVDEKTLGTAVCPHSPDIIAGQWRALVLVVRELAAVGQ